jgi:hypothetical protein
MNCQLAMSLQHNGKTLSENVYDLVLATRDWVAPGPTEKTVRLYAPDPSLGKLLEFVGVKCQAVPDLGEAGLGKTDVLVTGGFDGRESPPENWAAVRRFAEAGGQVLILHGGKYVQSLLPEWVDAVLEERGEIVNLRVSESECFDGIEQPDLQWWNVEPGKTPYACRRSFRLKDHPGAEALATYLRVHWYMSNPPEQLKDMSGTPLFEVALGRGRIVVCEMELEAAARDPLAGRLLRNLISSLGRARD